MQTNRAAHQGRPSRLCRLFFSPDLHIRGGLIAASVSELFGQSDIARYVYCLLRCMPSLKTVVDDGPANSLDWCRFDENQDKTKKNGRFMDCNGVDRRRIPRKKREEYRAKNGVYTKTIYERAPCETLISTEYLDAGPTRPQARRGKAVSTERLESRSD